MKTEDPTQQTDEEPLDRVIHLFGGWKKEEDAQSDPADAPQELSEPQEDEAQEPIPEDAPRRRRANAPVLHPERTPQEAARLLIDRAGTMHLRALLLLLLSLLSAAATLGHAMFGVWLPFLRDGATAAWIVLGILLLSALLSYDVLIRGVMRVASFRLNLETLAVVTTLVTILDGVMALRSGRVCFGAVACLQLWFALRSEDQRLDGTLRSLKAVGATEHPVSVLRKENGWNGCASVTRTDGSFYGFADALEAPDGAEQVMRVAAPVLLVLSLVLAMAAAARSGRALPWVWSGILCGSVPLMGFMCYTRPFRRLAAHLQKSGAAVFGWQGVRLLGGESYLVLQDADLFPKANVVQNGMKIYGSFRAGQVVAYAATVAMAAGSGLTELLQNEMKNYGVHEYPVGNFRRYEGGGYGAEVCGDVVLVGSARFMQLMGVRIGESTNVRTALYVAVNGVPAGMFALTYSPSSAVRAALATILRCRRLSMVLATRDCMLTIAMVREAYRLPPDRIDFPATDDRVQLSGQHDGETAALLTRSTLLPFTDTAAGACTLARVTRRGIVLSLLTALLGAALLFFLMASGSAASVSAANILLCAAAWTVPQLVLQSWISRY